MYSLYRAITFCASPFIPALLRARLARGKENAERLEERMGRASKPRPQGKLVWIHAASVGEANAALPLIDALLAKPLPPSILLTTVTVTSAALMTKHLPARAVHQFAPVDTPVAVQMFLAHWKPDIALWIDSEFWPNLIVETKKHAAVLGVINARVSEGSFRAWSFAKPLIEKLLGCFLFCFAQSSLDAQRLRLLGAPTISGIGNLKYDAPPLPVDETELGKLASAVQGRRVWLAASTHPGEEAMIAQVHRAVASDIKNLLTVIVPRHAIRGAEIATELSSLRVARRSKNDPITPETEIYIADTMGELGLFYRLARIAFIGGSLVPHGGQNPLEAARLGCAVVLGPHTDNFAEVTTGLINTGACIRVQDVMGLQVALQTLMKDEGRLARLSENALNHAKSQGGQVAHIMKELQPYLA